MRKNELRVWRENYTPWTKTCFSEGLRLEVHYEEKDFVKDIGGRWCPEMIAGQYGEVTESNGLLDATSNSTATEHPCVVRGTKIGTFYVFKDLDVVSFAPRDRNPNYNRNWYTLDKAREVWDKLNSKSQRTEMHFE